MARKWWTLVVVCLGIFMLLLDITIVNVALPDIAGSFHASLSALQWVIDAYALALASLLLTGGILADRNGRRLLFLIGVVIFTIGSALCGGAISMVFLSVSRAFQGIGGAIMFATSLALLSESFKGPERGVAFGLYGGMTGLAVATGPVIGGALVSGLGWRWIFFVNIPVGIFVFVIALLRVDESRDPEPKRLDLLGFITFSTGLFALIFGLIRTNHSGWSSLTVIGSLVAAFVLLAAFVASQLLRDDPMFDFKLLRVPTFDGGLVAAFAISASIFSVLTYLILWVQGLLGLSALATGVRFLPLSLSLFFTAAIAGRLTSLVPARLLIAPGFVLIGAGMLLMGGLTVTSGWMHLLAGHDRLRGGIRVGERASGGDGRGRGGAPPSRHGLRHQLHLSAGRHRGRHRGSRDHLREPHPFRRDRGPGRHAGKRLIAPDRRRRRERPDPGRARASAAGGPSGRRNGRPHRFRRRPEPHHSHLRDTLVRSGSPLLLLDPRQGLRGGSGPGGQGGQGHNSLNRVVA